ncbi:hypothetical protein BU15DRAFT_74261 [Melanogaster broomeanus]|nr:hypothetical protein BU15DRAFT_74261 [Melanogaster broomeanus]
MSLSHLFLGLLAISRTVFAQDSVTYTDPDNGITFQGYTNTSTDVTIGFVFPFAPDPNDEFIGEIVSPLTNKWIGVGLGGGMLDDLLLVAWPYEYTVVYSARYATSRTLPSPYEGPIIHTLPYTTINDTHWKWVFHCLNCTTWAGGGLDLTATSRLAWALSNTTVDDPSDPDSAFARHTRVGYFEEDFCAAQNPDYYMWALECYGRRG